MLISLLFLGALSWCVVGFDVPEVGRQGLLKSYQREYQILPKDERSGCKVLLYLPNSYYFYGDSCLEVPSGFSIPPNMDVSLRTTKIVQISKGDLDNWAHIESLSLEVNTELRTIQPGAFSKMVNLKNLTISNNYNMGTLSDDVFQGLVNLKELTYTNNNVTNIKSFLFCTRPAILPKLIKLDVSENPLGILNLSDFEYLEHGVVNTLLMSYCSLVYVDPNVFSPLVNLEFLSLANNNLNTSVINDLVISLNATAKNLTGLSVASNLLHKNPYLLLKSISSMSVKYLDLSENHFDPMASGSFPYMPNLETLDMSGIKAVSFENGTLTEDVVPNLKYLVLSKNRLTGMMNGFLLPNLLVLDVSENTCETCYTASLFKINDFQLEKMADLEVLNLSNNNLYHIRQFMFFNLINLRELFLSNCTIYRIDTSAFANSTSLEHLDLSHNNFIKSSALVKSTFEGLSNLISLKLDSSKISYLSSKDVFEHLKNLKYLDIRDNTIVEFNPAIFSCLMSLELVDLSYNNVLEWDMPLFSNNTNLKYLLLIGNQISEVTVNMLKEFANIKFVGLSDNPLYCTCSAMYMVRDYIESIGFPNIDLNLLHLNDTKNFCLSPRQWGNTEFVDYLNYNLKTGYCDNYILVITGITIIVLISVALFVCLMYYLRWHIRYWVFLLRQAMRHNYFPKKKTPPEGKYKYDAFVSYSHEDRSFVVRLVSMLESQEPFLSLCVFERDFDVGGIITESVMESLESSKRTILVLSDSFARSTWCLWEMQMAQHKWVFFKDEENDPLIIIKIGEIMDKHMTPTLRYLIKTRIYLQWNPDPKKQKVFWQKLRSALSKPTMN